VVSWGWREVESGHDGGQVRGSAFPVELDEDQAILRDPTGYVLAIEVFPGVGEEEDMQNIHVEVLLAGMERQSNLGSMKRTTDDVNRHDGCPWFSARFAVQEGDMDLEQKKRKSIYQ
jgi:hypothetical protein